MILDSSALSEHASWIQENTGPPRDQVKRDGSGSAGSIETRQWSRKAAEFFIRLEGFVTAKNQACVPAVESSSP